MRSGIIGIEQSQVAWPVEPWVYQTLPVRHALDAISNADSYWRFNQQTLHPHSILNQQEAARRQAATINLLGEK